MTLRFRHLLAAAAAMTALSAAAAITIVDDAGRTVTLAAPAQRIVSLAPHVTENLFAIGAGERIVGTVDYSDYPVAAKTIPRIGGYSRIDLEAVAALRPDLVVAWQTGNNQAQMDKLRGLGIPVLLTQSNRIDDVAASLERLGEATGTGATARAAASGFRERVAALRARYGNRPTVRTFYEVWHQPLTTIGGSQIISDAIRLCGGENIFAGLTSMAPKVSAEAVVAADPEAVVASGMGEARPEWLDLWRQWRAMTAVARNNLFFIPPEIIQRHTPRLLDGAEMLCKHLETARGRRPR
ncbi:MAG: cobalamin-binding protein [Rhodocyclales bacterium]|nr:cobalamin-binding protein [Rhodocyclales bacterium]